MTHNPNLALLGKLNLGDLESCAELFAEDFVWHYFNPRLPELAGDYAGLEGLKSFFDELGTVSSGTFEHQTLSVTPWGEELLVMFNKNRLTVNGEAMETDVVLVWRFAGGRIAEVWDIPSVHAGARPSTDTSPTSSR